MSELDTSSNNKRIAKNTMFLYIRMLFIMAVQLYTSRVVLNTLGVVDYGLYNVVGGVVSMLSFVNGAMSSATQRYITFALGKGDFDNLNKVFSVSVSIHFLIAFIVLLFAETVGLWFLYSQMTIPEGRMDAAIWVYQASVISTMVSIVSVPYNAEIIAHEKMSAFAYISILEVVLKLLIVYLLVITPLDKLKLYALLILAIQILIRYIYGHYCTSHFQESRFRYVSDKKLFKEMVSFAGWSLFGNLAGILSTQGVNIVLNIFFGPVINAARGVAVQVQSAITSFSGNFQMAINPQITKSYAQEDKERLFKLIKVSSKFSFFLILLLELPVFLEAPNILSVWLVNVPAHSIYFLRLILLIVLIDTTANSFIIAAQATGRVRVYQSVVGSCILLIVPLSYIVMKILPIPELVFVVHMSIAVVAQILRILFMRSYIGLGVREVIKSIYLPCLIVLGVSFAVPFALQQRMTDDIKTAAVIVLVSLIWSAIIIYFVGFSKHEKEILVSAIKKFKNGR